ncbi:MAG: phosphoribosylglycinamide formyltransferase [Schwartzia sp.]|nr:phosphoribosylglycinamide formyltransferase [Schwartzia sp. (in: firmicutes)]
MSEKEILGVLCSGRGTNLQSILAAVDSGQIPAPVGVVLVDVPGAKALERAEKAGIPHFCVDRKQYADKQTFEKALVEKLRAHGVTLVILAGFMRILSPYFVHEFPGRIMNIHPSLLPSFGGAHAHRDVLAYGVKVSGCTIHFVDEGMDSGPIILQTAVPVLGGDDEDSLAARVLVEEHKLYPRAIELFLKGKLKVEGRKVLISE